MNKDIAQKLIKEQESLSHLKFDVRYFDGSHSIRKSIMFTFSLVVNKDLYCYFDGKDIIFDYPFKSSFEFPIEKFNDFIDITNDIKFYCKTFQKRYDEILNIIENS